MKIYISADIEGVTGTTHPDEANKKQEDYKEFREQMTAEVAAACEGALAAGAKEVWVKDAHWTGRNLFASKLPREVRLVRDWSKHPYMMMQELDDSFDAALMVGYHSRAASDGLPLAHTLSGSVAHVKVNDCYASEFRISSYTAGLVRVPVVFLSGDAGVCEEAKAFIPGVGVVPTMRGVGSSTVSIHPGLAVERIRAGVEEALKGDLARCRVELPADFSIEVRYKQHTNAYAAGFYPGARLQDSYTVVYDASDWFDVLRFFLFAID